MSVAPGSRRVVPLSSEFFCDGPYYVVTSSSLGGGEVTAERVSRALGDGDREEIREFLESGVCLPLAFPGDCAFDDAIVVIGELSESEEDEWIGRISSRLSVPCGQLVVLCGGGDAYELEEALSRGGESELHTTIEVPPGDYRVDVYAYVSSMTVDFLLEEGEPPSAWFERTRPQIRKPKWVRMWDEQGMAGQLGDELVSYILRLSPIGSALPDTPALDEDLGWAGVFEARWPALCPLGIPRSELLG